MLARQRIASIWQQLKDLGIGELFGSDNQLHLRKYDIASLVPGCIEWLRKHRVPLSHFGLRSHVDHSAFFGHCHQQNGRDPQAEAEQTTESQPKKEAAAPATANVTASPKKSRRSNLRAAVSPSKKPTKQPPNIWSDLGRVELGSPLLSKNALLAHLRTRPEWAHCKVSVRCLWENKERILSEIRCVTSETCQCRWRTHYILAKTIYTPGTLIIQQTGSHSGHGDTPPASGKLFTVKEKEVAVAFFADGGRSAKNLRAALLAAGSSEASLPNNKQLGDWLRRSRKQSKAALDRDQNVVAAVQLDLDSLPQSLPKQVDAIFLLQAPLLTESEVCILFACPGMLDTLNRYMGQDIAFVVDTKMKVLDRGMGVATLSLLVKDNLRPTHLPKAGKGARTQSRAWTSHAMPVLQAIFHAETKPNYVRLFETCCEQWAARHPDKTPLQDQLTLQLHKDFHASIEEARRQVFPLSRACDDFFHMTEKMHTTMKAKCQQLVLRKGKYVKKNLHFALEMISILRFVPTLPLFSWLWKTFLTTLEKLGEPTLAQWLQSYERPLPALFRYKYSSDVAYVSFWVGLDGIIPGSGSGSEPAEALHASWQTALAELGGKGNIGHAFTVLQKLYTQHWQDWYSWTDATTLSFIPHSQDPQLVNGNALARAGRTPAAMLAKLEHDKLYLTQQSETFSWIACASTAATSPLNRAIALQVLRVLQNPTTLTASSLPDLFTVDKTLCLQAMKFHFESIVYLKVEPASILCSCAAAAMHALCEHSTFLRSLDLPHVPRPLLILNDVPCARKRNGRPATAAAPPRKRRKAVWVKLPSTLMRCQKKCRLSRIYSSNGFACAFFSNFPPASIWLCALFSGLLFYFDPFACELSSPFPFHVLVLPGLRDLRLRGVRCISTSALPWQKSSVPHCYVWEAKRRWICLSVAINSWHHLAMSCGQQWW